VNEFFERLTDPATLTQLLLIAATLLAGLGITHLTRQWVRRAGFAARAGWQPRLVEGLGTISGTVCGLIVLLVANRLLDPSGARGPLDIAMELGVAFVCVRLGVYLLRLAFGTNTWLAQWEGRLAVSIWALLALSLVGWFGFVENTLDSMDLIPGKTRFTLWALLKGLVVVTIFVMIASLISRTVESRVMRIEAIALSTRLGITKFTYFFLIALGVMIGINAAGVDLTALTVLTGAVGIGLGFGLQAIASNFVSGFVLLMDKSIKPGDVISFTGTTGTSTENFGWVQELRGRYVVVRDRDGVETLVPNQNLITTPVINWSYSDRKVRLKLPVRISYDDDPEQALTVLLEAAKASPRVLRDPEPVSRLMHFSDHGIDLELRFWIADPENGVNNVRSDVNRAIWQHFKQARITIPVAQRDVRMVTTRGGGA
jgi:small-conductance mechanosensitive channel